MPKAVEDCVKKISGTNKRTGKPYTDSEKWAICTAAHKNKMDNAELNPEDFSELVANAVYNYATQIYNAKTTPSMVMAYELAQIALAKANYNYEVLEMIIGK